MTMANTNKTKVITGINTRLSYFHGWEPASINGSKERYSTSVLIPKKNWISEAWWLYTVINTE